MRRAAWTPHQDLCLIDPAANLPAGSSEEEPPRCLPRLPSTLPLSVGRTRESLRTHEHCAPRPRTGSTDGEKYHSIRLYEELPVVILPVDHVLTVLGEVPVEELAEEFLLQPASDIPDYEEVSRAWRENAGRIVPEGLTDKGNHRLVAAGVDLYIVPMSIARFYHRKDLTYRPLRAWTSTRCTWWPRAPKGRAAQRRLEALLQDFIGIVRGRTAASDRGSEPGRHALNASPPKSKGGRHEPPTPAEARDKKRANAKKTVTHASTPDRPPKPPVHAAARNAKER